MNTPTKRILVSAIATTAITSIAMSQLIAICQSCTKLPKPKAMCVQDENPPTVTFCGSEQWLIEGTDECKRIDIVTLTCLNGGSIRYTTERWWGAGTTCTPEDEFGYHGCY